MRKAEYGLQLYSLRDLSATDLRAALRQTADMGYRYVEFAGFFGHDARQVRQWLKEYDLLCSGTHTGMDLIRPDRIDETIEYHLQIDCRHLIVPSADWSSASHMRANIASLQRAQETLAAAGIRLGYHNHSGEFLPTPYGKIVMDELLAETTVDLEIDTFWAYNAGIDPVSFLDAHKARVRVLHLKDGIPCAPSKRTFADWSSGVVGKSLGEGNAPVLAIRDWAVANGVLLVVESERLNPTGVDEAARCIAFLHANEVSMPARFTNKNRKEEPS